MLWICSSTLVLVRETFPVPSTSEMKQLHRKKWGPLNPIMFEFLVLTPIAIRLNLIAFNYKTHKAQLLVWKLEKGFLFCFDLIFSDISAMAKKEWSHFIPIQTGAREKWFGLNRTTVLLCSVLLRRLCWAQRRWIQSYFCGLWVLSNFQLSGISPFSPSLSDLCCRLMHGLYVHSPSHIMQRAATLSHVFQHFLTHVDTDNIFALTNTFSPTQRGLSQFPCRFS